MVADRPAFDHYEKMKSLLKSLLNAIPGSIMTGIAWWVINDFFAVRQQGFLEKQAWPLSSMPVCIAIGAACAVLVSFVALLILDVRREKLVQTLEALGLQVQAAISQGDLGIPDRIRFLDSWQNGEHLATGSFAGVEIQLFEFQKEYRSSTSKGPQSRTETQTVILLPVPEGTSASVQLLRKQWISLFSTAEGVVLSGKGNCSDPVDSELIETFNHTFFISNPERNTGDQHAYLQSIKPITQLPFLRAVMECGHKWNVEISNSRITLWVKNRTVTAGSAKQAIGEALAIRRALLAPALASDALAVQSDQGQEHTFNVGPMVVGGCVGMLLAFLSFAPVFFLFVADHPWVVFIWPVYGLAVMAGSAFLASRWTRRRKKQSSHRRQLDI